MSTNRSDYAANLRAAVLWAVEPGSPAKRDARMIALFAQMLGPECVGESSMSAVAERFNFPERTFRAHREALERGFQIRPPGVSFEEAVPEYTEDDEISAA